MMTEGEICWVPSAERIEQSQMQQFMGWLRTERGLHFAEYEALWRWSVDDAEGFWDALWEFFEIIGDRPKGLMVQGADMLGARWFEGSRVNYAEHMLRHERDAEQSEIAIQHSSEIRPLASMTWQELGAAVRKTATNMRALGLQPGDRVVSYMPNIIETAIAMLASTAIGCVWSSAAPEFGVRTVVDRFGQIGPKLMFAADGYSFAGKLFDRREEVAAIAAEISSLEHIVWLPYIYDEAAPALPVPTSAWSDLASGPDIASEQFAFERVAYDHPLWVLFSSGTTGLPKGIAHSHVGMLLDQTKAMRLHFDLSPGQSMFFFTTAGWMMWNAVMSALLARASAVLFDGSPTWPDQGKLWTLAEESGATLFGASPTLVKMMDDAGIHPGETYDLSRMNKLVLGGAPATPATFEWVYRHVKQDLWVINTSGGTDLCGGLVGPVPTRPVRAAEMQGIVLGLSVESWDEDGNPLVDAVGELVVTKSFPSQPLFFWGDEGHERYRATYFERFPGVWWHGDFVKITSEGGCYIYGRSDATLNRFGVRIGSAEIYAVLAKIDRIVDSAIVCCETTDGGYFMPLFVQLRDGDVLDDTLIAEIATRLRAETSPRHIPDDVFQVPLIPYTLTGKRMEIPIRKLIMGTPAEKIVSRDAMADGSALDWFVDFAGSPENKAFPR